MDALIYLMFYGDKRAKQPIWNRYVQWSDTWKGREAALGARQPGGIGNNWEQQGLGENLATALISNQGWLSDKELISQVLNRCVGEQMCTQLKQLAASADAPYRVSLYRSGRTENDTIAQYSEKNEDLLQEKLDQFPRGTSFIMMSDSTQSEEQQNFESHIRALFEKAGMSLLMEKQ